ncbi:MAG TPA: helix-turn-helix domain-containing protein [Verrucomicrobiae bacterium]|nr:helix-turn-helix domain-containing protein [Verrucomicrobiae bacterium]
MKHKDDSNQLTLTFAPTITPRGDGSFIVTPGKPLVNGTLTVQQLAAQFHVNEDSVYRWIREEVIPAEHVSAAGMRRLRIAAAAVPVLQEKFLKLHD